MSEAPHNAVQMTVNAPYRVSVDLDELVTVIRACEVDRAQVGSFLTEVPMERQPAFVNEVGLTRDGLVRVALAYRDWSGNDVPLAA